MPDGAPRIIQAPPVTIISATDLGNVEVTKEGNHYLLTDPRGDIRPDGRGLGLYHLDTRILSTSILRLNGSQLTLLRGPYRDRDADTIQLTNPELRRNPADKQAATPSLARRELSVTRTRRIQGGLHEQVVVESYSATTEDLDIELGLGVDMADIFEVRGYPRTVRGTLCPIELFDDRVVFGYDGLDGRRRTTTVTLAGDRLEPADDPEIWPGASVVARWTAQLAPGKRLAIGWTVTDETVDIAPATAKGRPGGPGPRPDLEPRFEVPNIRSDHELLDRTLARSIVDLAALHNDGPGPGEQYMAAGIPWFATLFGRDSLIAALETVAFIPTLAVATLEVLARLQATKDDPWRDAEPGKILHEMRTGEMALAGEIPHDALLRQRRFDAALADPPRPGPTRLDRRRRDCCDRLWPNALAALDWIERSGDRDGDGFVEYERRSSSGCSTRAGRTRATACRHADGSPAEGPIALVEVQGYVYAARRALARLARAPRRDGAARPGWRLECREPLVTRFNEAFWMPEARLLRDRARRREAQVGCDHLEPGAGAVGGIVTAKRAARVAERLLEHPTCSAAGASGRSRRGSRLQPDGLPHGLDLAARQRADRRRASSATASADGANLLAGLLRGRPGSRTCVCPSCSAGSTGPRSAPRSATRWRARRRPGRPRRRSTCSTRMLGLRADASARRLELIRPTLPDWLTKLTITGLPVGDDSVDLLVHRWRGRTSAELLGRRGTIDVIIHA